MKHAFSLRERFAFYSAIAVIAYFLAAGAWQTTDWVWVNAQVQRTPPRSILTQEVSAFTYPGRTTSFPVTLSAPSGKTVLSISVWTMDTSSVFSFYKNGDSGNAARFDSSHSVSLSHAYTEDVGLPIVVDRVSGSGALEYIIMAY